MTQQLYFTYFDDFDVHLLFILMRTFCKIKEQKFIMTLLAD